MSSQFDVVVAGAGPAGLLFARNLALAGFRVALLERDNAESLGKSIVVDVERSIFPRVELAAPKGEEIAFEPSGERSSQTPFLHFA